MIRLTKYLSIFSIVLQLLIAESGEYTHIVKYYHDGDSWQREIIKTFTDPGGGPGRDDENINGIAIGDADNDGTNEIYIGLDSTRGTSIPNYRDIKAISYDGEKWIENNLSLTFSDGCDAYCTPNHIAVSDINMDGEEELYALSSRWLDTFEKQADGSWNNTNVWFNSSVGSNYPRYLKTDDFDGDGFDELYIGVSTGCYGGYLTNFGYLNDNYTGTSPGTNGAEPRAFVVYDYDNSGNSQLIVSHNGHGNPNCSSNYGWPTITNYDNNGQIGDIYSYPSYNTGAAFLVSSNLDQNDYNEIYFNNYEYFIKYEFLSLIHI